MGSIAETPISLFVKQVADLAITKLFTFGYWVAKSDKDYAISLKELKNRFPEIDFQRSISRVWPNVGDLLLYNKF